MKLLVFFLNLLCISICSHAQIGYQVALLNNATGEPRSNETVTVTVKITDKDKELIFEQSGQSTTNDFGVLSLTVGNSDTFANADWSKLPFFIEATVGGRLIGKSQLLSVPVAEHAKHYGSLTKEILCSRVWKCGESTITFMPDGTYKSKWSSGKSDSGKYKLDGNYVRLYDNDGDDDTYRYFQNFDSLIYITDSHELK